MSKWTKTASDEPCCSTEARLARGTSLRALAFALLTLSALTLAACGSKTNDTTLGGESHFLSDCGDGCTNGLECVGGVCTKQCNDADECEDLASDSVSCTSAGDLGARVCDVECTRDTDCESLGSSHACDSGFCRGGADSSSDDDDGSDDEADDETSADDDDVDAGGCVVDGTTYELGESFDCADGCNTCTCTAQGIGSTMIACGVDDDATPSDGCSLNGETYRLGDVFDCPDECNTCTCTPEGIQTTEMDCEPSPTGQCVDGDETYDVGDSWRCSDGCNSCACIEDGEILQTAAECGPGEGCTVDGEFFETNALVPCGNGCECFCNADGSVSDPDGCNEPTSPEQTFTEWESCGDDGACICDALERCEAAWFRENLALGSHDVRSCAVETDDCVVSAFEEEEGYGIGYECRIPLGSVVCDEEFTFDAIRDRCTRLYDCSLLLGDDCPERGSCDNLGASPPTDSDAGAGTDDSTPGDDDTCSDDCESSGLTCCDGQCINAENDPFNCGGCGIVCAEGEMCNVGTCAEASCGDCADGEMCCLIMQGPWFVQCTAPDEGTCPVGCPLCECASPDTKIATPDGERDIATLRVGDVVYSVENEGIVEAPIAEVRQTAVFDHEVVQVELSNGRVLRISARHPTADGRNFGLLLSGQTLDGVEIVAAHPIPYAHPFTYDILPDTSTGLYFAEGVAIGSTLHEASMVQAEAAAGRPR